MRVVADVGTPAPETPLAVTTTADVASAKVSPEAVEIAIREWIRIQRNYERYDICDLARHIAEVLNGEQSLVMAEVRACRRALDAEGARIKRRLTECSIPDFDIPKLDWGFNGA